MDSSCSWPRVFNRTARLVCATLANSTGFRSKSLKSLFLVICWMAMQRRQNAAAFFLHSSFNPNWRGA